MEYRVHGHSAVGTNRWIHSLQVRKVHAFLNQITYECEFKSGRIEDIARQARTDANPSL